MILSFIEIGDFKSGPEQIKDSAVTETFENGQDTERLSAEKKLTAKGLFTNARNQVNPDNSKGSPENFENINSAGQLFGDTFELRYLQHKEKIEKERFVRELLTGKN